MGLFSVRILNPPREHGPPHVHVVKGRSRGGEVVINLGEQPGESAGGGRISICEVWRMSDTDVVKTVDIVQDNIEQLRLEWKRLHGTA